MVINSIHIGLLLVSGGLAVCYGIKLYLDFLMEKENDV